MFGFNDGFSVQQVDETAQVTDMMGASSVVNQSQNISASPSKSLMYAWFLILGLYWFLGWFFKGARRS